MEYVVNKFCVSSEKTNIAWINYRRNTTGDAQSFMSFPTTLHFSNFFGWIIAPNKHKITAAPNVCKLNNQKNWQELVSLPI